MIELLNRLKDWFRTHGSVYVVTGSDEEGLQEIIVLRSLSEAQRIYAVLRAAYGGSNCVLASRKINAVPYARLLLTASQFNTSSRPQGDTMSNISAAPTSGPMSETTSELNRYIHESILGKCWHEMLDPMGPTCCKWCGLNWPMASKQKADYCSDDSPRRLLNEVVAKVVEECGHIAYIKRLNVALATAEQIARACVAAHKELTGTQNAVTTADSTGTGTEVAK